MIGLARRLWHLFVDDALLAAAPPAAALLGAIAVRAGVPRAACLGLMVVALAAALAISVARFQRAGRMGAIGLPERRDARR